MTYKLTNLTDNTTTICEKVTIEGCDYYVSDNKILEGDFFVHKNKWIHECNYLLGEDRSNIYDDNHSHYFDFDCRKIVATTNPSLPISQIVDEVELLAYNYYISKESYKVVDSFHFINGYKSHAQTHKWTDEDMCDLIQQLKDYTHEILSILGHDEREPIEFLEIFKSTRQTQVYCK